MALNFPNAPVEGQVYTAEGVTFVWTSGQWVVTFPWASNSEALAGTRADVAMAPLTLQQAITARNFQPAAMGGAPVDKDGSRVLGSTYQNTKGVHLMVTASLLHPNIGESQMLVGPTGSLTGLIVAILTTSFANTRAAVTTVVPPTWHYRLVGTTGASIINWWEY